MIVWQIQNEIWENLYLIGFWKGMKVKAHWLLKQKFLSQITKNIVLNQQHHKLKYCLNGNYPDF